MSVAGEGGATPNREALEEDIARMKKEDAEVGYPVNKEAIDKAERVLEELGS